MDTNTLHIILGLIASAASMAAGKYWGTLETRLAAYIAKEEAQLKAAAEVVADQVKAAVDAVEARAAADLAKAKADAVAVLPIAVPAAPAV